MADHSGIALVTGATGFIGSHLVEALVAGGWTVRCLVRRTSDPRWLPRERVELVFGDLGDPRTRLDDALRDVSHVLHLAGVTSAVARTDYARVNVEGTSRLVDAVTRISPDARFVYCSSLAAAGPSPADRPVHEDDPPRPISAYGRSKLEAERLLAQSALRHVIVRPPAVYGPRDVDILAGFRLARRGLALRIAPRGQRLSMIHVADLVAGLCAAAERAAGGCYYLSSGTAHTWEELVSSMGAAVGRRVRVVPVGESVAMLVARAERALAGARGRKPLLTPDRIRELVQPAWTCDDAKARRELGYRAAVPLEQGIRETAEWYRSVGWL